MFNSPEVHAGAIVAFAVVLVLVMLFVGNRDTAAMRRYTSTPARLALMRRFVALIWALTAVAVALAWPQNLLVLAAGAGDMTWLLANPAARWTAAGLMAVLVVAYALPYAACGLRPSLRQHPRIRAGVRHLQCYLPVSPVERRWWILGSLSAGICEEVLARGYLLQLASGRLVPGIHLELGAALLVTSLIFGLGHYYQGVRGVLGSGAVGLLLGLMAVLSGNLLLPIVVHSLLDAQLLLIYNPQADRPHDAERLVRGCDPALV